MARKPKEPGPWNQIGSWTRDKRLGAGGFGSVYIGIRDSDKKRFAVKSVYFVPRSTKQDPYEAASELLDEQLSLSSLVNEIRTLKKLKSPYIVRYIGCGTSKGPKEMNRRLVLDCYLEFLPRGSLYHIVKQSPDKCLKEPFIKAYTKDILRGLMYLHFNKLVHGDLKCLNVLMGPDNCKIADFGSVKDVRTSFFNKILFGTDHYQAPEVEAYSEQTYASDVFSLGCVVLEMATGKSPRPKEKRRLVDTDHYANRNIPAHLTPECKDFLSKCFATDPRSRWTASALLQHPFIMEPSSPSYHPYHMPLDVTTERQILQILPKLIIPPSDLDSGLSCAPFSPIHVVPMKRRRTGCQYVNEADVAVPDFASARPPIAYSDPVRDKHSAARLSAWEAGQGSCPPPYKSELYPSDSDGNYVTPTAEKRETRHDEKSRAALDAISRLNPAIVTVPNQPQRSEVASKLYKGYRLDFPAVAQLDGNDEDRSPFVVKICSEFGIPLPEEYKNWTLDPHYDPYANPGAPYRGPFRRFLGAMFGLLEHLHGYTLLK